MLKPTFPAPGVGHDLTNNDLRGFLDYSEFASGPGFLFALDAANSSGLTLAYFAGRTRSGAAVVEIPAASIALPPSQANVYVEVNAAGVVSQNATGFTSGSSPLYQCATNSVAITNIADKRLVGGGSGATGDMEKSVYDTDNDGQVDSANFADDAEKLQGMEPSDFASASGLSDEAAARVTADAAINTALAAKADLVSGKIPAAQLPASFDDVQIEANLAAFPATGETNKIYVAANTNFEYRWNGSSYTRLNEGVVLGTTSSTAHRGDHGAAAYNHSQATGNPHNTTKADVGLGNAQNTSDADKPVSAATQSALNFKAPLDSPAFTGVPEVPTAAPGTNTDQIASTAFVIANATGDTNQNARQFKAGPVSGAAAGPTYRAIEYSDLPNPAPVELMDAATIETDLALGNTFDATSAVARHFGIPENPADGGKYTWRWKNDSSGALTPTLETSGAGAFRYGLNVTILPSVPAGKTLYFGAIYNLADERLDVVARDIF